MKFTVRLVSVLLAVTGVRTATAAPLATFECQEITGRDWARTLVTYPLELKAGQARPGAVRLTDGQGHGHLRWQHSLGTSGNAVKTQIWIAMAAYLLVAISTSNCAFPGNCPGLCNC